MLDQHPSGVLAILEPIGRIDLLQPFGRDVNWARHLFSRILKWKRRNWLITPPDAEWLRSPSYQDEMSVGLNGSQPGLNEAMDETPSYNHRHRVANRTLGVWRWRGMQEHRDLLLELFEGDKLVVDLGGAACPLGLGATVVDMLRMDNSGERVNFSRMSELPGPADVVFTSHCLEHIENLDEVLEEIRDGMSEGGHFVSFVPAWTCVRWRSGVHENSIFNDHAWTFALSGDELPDLDRVKRIDDEVSKFFEVSAAEYCGDNSIFIHATKA